MRFFNVEERLKLEGMRRTTNGALSQIFLAFIMWAVFLNSHSYQWLWTGGFWTLICYQVVRYSIYKAHVQKPRRLLRKYKLLMVLSLSTALTWGILAGLAISIYGLLTIEGVGMLLGINGILCAVTYSLASAPKLQRTFITLTATPVLIVLFRDPTYVAHFIGALYIVFGLYLLAISRNHAFDLRRTYEAEEGLREEKEKLSFVLDSVPGFVALADQTGKWIEMSWSFQKFTHVQTLEAALQKFLASNDSAMIEEIDWVENDIEYCFVVSFARLTHPEGAVVLSGVPTVELRNVKRQLELQRSKAEYSSRLATLGEMAAGIAHEINNPLAIILGSAYQMDKLVNMRFPGEQSLSKFTAKIVKTSDRIGKIIQNLRYFSRQGDQDPFVETEIGKIIDDTLELCREKFINHGVALEIGEIPQIKVPVRPVQISQVLINLLNNSFDAVSHSAVRRIEVLFRIELEHLVISIRDTGNGVPETIVQRIFEPFYTTKEVGQGTGLGLSVSRGIMLDHQGSLGYVQNQEMTTFEVHLPLKRFESVTEVSRV